jgi:cellulose biosynthesis protein BcsQ
MSALEIAAGWILVNASGQLTFITGVSQDAAGVAQSEAAAAQALGPYLNPDFGVVSADTPGVSAIVESASPYKLRIESGQAILTVRIIDQRLVGRDWLSPPSTTSVTSMPSVVFASLKGGVGRTTALAVVAAHLAAEGRKLLVVDLDLEAPGIGAMLLKEDDLPRFGMLDAFVEAGIRAIDDEFLYDMVAASSFGTGNGLIDVVPATGSVADAHPENVLAKLARAYVDGFDDVGNLVSFGDRTRVLVGRLAALKSYDLVLVDARAGLNESTAAAMLALGAHVLLFGEDTPQTFAGYRYLLAHLGRFARNPNDDWVARLKMVYAKASPLASDQQGFRDRAHDVFQEFIYVEEPVGPYEDFAGADAASDDMVAVSEFMLDEVGAPHYALPVLMDTNYFRFDPLTRPEVLVPALYEHSYRELLTWIASLVYIDEGGTADGD